MGHTHEIMWTDTLIKEKILEVKEKLALDRMPSRKECQEYFHNDALTNAVSRRMKWYTLANELGLPIKESETFFGKRHESIAAEMLTANGFEVRKMPQNFPYDLLVNDYVKVDVKASHLYKGRNGNFYTFNLEKPYATCDVYILFAIDDQDQITNTFVIPSKFVITNS